MVNEFSRRTFLKTTGYERGLDRLIPLTGYGPGAGSPHAPRPPARPGPSAGIHGIVVAGTDRWDA